MGKLENKNIYANYISSNAVAMRQQENIDEASHPLPFGLQQRAKTLKFTDCAKIWT